MKKVDDHCMIPEICGTTTLGERGQVVIPKTIRASQDLKKGDSFVIMSHGNKIVLIPSVEFKEMITQMSSMIGSISKTL